MQLSATVHRLVAQRIRSAAANVLRAGFVQIADRYNDMNAAPHTTFAHPAARPNEFLIRVSDAALKNEQYNLPVRFHSQLAGKCVPFLSTEGQPLGEVRISKSGALSGFNRLISPKRGDLFRVLVAAAGLRVELVVLESASAPDGRWPMSDFLNVAEQVLKSWLHFLFS